MSATKRSTAVPVSLLCLLALAGCTNASSTAGGAGSAAGGSAQPSGSDGAIPVEVNEQARALLPEDVRESGVIVVASDPTYPPFEFMAEDKKTLKGFDVDLTDMLAQSLGVRAEHQAATFDTILPGLSSGKYDVGASSFTVTEERRKAVDFVPYFAGGTALAVPTGNPEGLSVADDSLCGRSVAAQKGTIQALEQLPGFSRDCVDAGKDPIGIQTFPLQSDANLALVAGRVDGILSDSASLAYQGKEAGGKFELAPGEDYEPARIGVATPKDSELTAALTEAMKGLADSDAYDQLYAKWEIPAQGQLSPGDIAGTDE